MREGYYFVLRFTLAPLGGRNEVRGPVAGNVATLFPDALALLAGPSAPSAIEIVYVPDNGEPPEYVGTLYPAGTIYPGTL